SRGDVLAVEILEFRPSTWGGTEIIPGFGLLADVCPQPGLRVWRVDEEKGRVEVGEDVSLPYRPFPGTIGVAPSEPGVHSIVPPSRFGGDLHIHDLQWVTTLFAARHV